MVTTSEARVEAEFEELADKRPYWSVARDFVRKQPLGSAGLAIVAIMIIAAIFAPILTPYDPEANSFEHMLTAPNFDFLLGTDQFGRDLLSRIIYGARTALFVGFTAAFIGATLGLILASPVPFSAASSISSSSASWTS